MTYVLRYVCKFCGREIAAYPAIPSHEPATVTVCNAPACRAQASAAYKAGR